jgi:hypothetical protein
MRILSLSKDGGPDSPVDGFFLIEIKSLFSIVLLRFNEGGREAFHTHAFNALTWFLAGDMEEEDIDGYFHFYQRSLIPKYTPRSKNHRVWANRTSWCLSIRGPWNSTWTEDTDTHHTVLTHGRKVVERVEK